jgi:sugar lactone lactonase YvrE
MHLDRSLVALFCATTALISLSACAAGRSQVAPATNPQIIVERGSTATGTRLGLRIVDPATIKAQIYVGQYGAPSDPGEVNDYNANNSKDKKEFCQVSDLTGVNAIAVDSTGELWIPQQNASGVNEVTSIAPDCGKAGTTLSDPNGQPNDIAFNSSGVRYVSDIVGNGSTAGDISVYPKGKTSPTSTLTDSAVFYSQGVAVDSHGNVYQAFVNQAVTKGGILEFAAGKMPGKIIKDIKITVPGVPILDKSDDIIVTDDATTAVNIYAPPYNKAPKTFPLEGTTSQCSLNKAETNIACADRGNDSIDIYSYPAGKYSYSFSNGLGASPLLTIGIAQDPI